MNLREALTAASRPAPKRIEIEGIEAEVFARVLTVGEIIEQQKDTKDTENRPAIARAFARIVSNPDGSPVYDATSTEDIKAILALPWPLVKRVMEQANLLNGVADSAEAVEKN